MKWTKESIKAIKGVIYRNCETHYRQDLDDGKFYFIELEETLDRLEDKGKSPEICFYDNKENYLRVWPFDSVEIEIVWHTSTIKAKIVMEQWLYEI